MKYSFLWILFSLGMLVSCQTNQEQTTKNTDQIRAMENGKFMVQNAQSSLVIDPDKGARIISLRFNHQELLTDTVIHPDNYGSTLWLSPQRIWGWPPPPGLDLSSYQVRSTDDVLVLTSPTDESSGYQLIKKIMPLSRDNVFKIIYSIKNISDTIQSVAAWEVTRTPATGISFFLADSTAILPKSNLPVHQENEVVWFEPAATEFNQSLKLFANGKEGWLAHAFEGVLFIKTFPDIAPEQAAPSEEEVEIYAHRDKSYIELENQSAFQQLLPGDSLDWPVVWHLHQIPPDLKVETGNEALIQLVRTLIAD
ncbi:MAG: DUF4380 domain-containing protein [Candidatus Cyclobacteriaceae bacterium M3_2C_046]